MKKDFIIEFQASPGATPAKGAITLDLVELPAFSQLADGSYQVSIVSGVATWLLNPIPAAPAVDGLTYHLTVVDGVYTWVVVA